jgi:hypothetical protein
MSDHRLTSIASEYGIESELDQLLFDSIRFSLNQFNTDMYDYVAHKLCSDLSREDRDALEKAIRQSSQTTLDAAAAAIKFHNTMRKGRFSSGS